MSATVSEHMRQPDIVLPVGTFWVESCFRCPLFSSWRAPSVVIFLSPAHSVSLFCLAVFLTVLPLYYSLFSRCITHSSPAVLLTSSPAVLLTLVPLSFSLFPRCITHSSPAVFLTLLPLSYLHLPLYYSLLSDFFLCNSRTSLCHLQHDRSLSVSMDIMSVSQAACAGNAQIRLAE